MKVYKLRKGNWKYKNLKKRGSYSFDDLQNYINKSRVQRALKERKKFIKKYKRPNPWFQLLKLLIFYYALIGFIILLSKFGI